jgi:hypothetical protein
LLTARSRTGGTREGLADIGGFAERADVTLAEAIARLDESNDEATFGAEAHRRRDLTLDERVARMIYNARYDAWLRGERHSPRTLSTALAPPALLRHGPRDLDTQLLHRVCGSRTCHLEPKAELPAADVAEIVAHHEVHLGS